MMRWRRATSPARPRSPPPRQAMRRLDRYTRPATWAILPGDMSNEITGRHLIDGEWRASAQGGAGAFRAVDPSTGETLPPDFAEASADDVDAAMHAASAAFETSLDLPPRWSADLLEVIADRIMDLGDVL